MAIFGSTTKTYVGNSTTQLIEDDLLPELVRDSTIRSILRNEPITTNIVGAVIDSLTLRVNRAYNYANSGLYEHGLPTHSFLDGATGYIETQNILEDLVGGPVVFEYYVNTPMNPMHLMFARLHEDYGYNENTNQITAYSFTGNPAYMHNIIGKIEADALDNSYLAAIGNLEEKPNSRFTPWVNPRATQTNFASGGLQTGADLLYGYDGGASENTISFTFPDYDKDTNYIHAKYYYDLDSTNPKVGYFTYEHGSGLYPSIDSSLVSGSNISEFLPVTFFIKDGELVGREDNQASNEYTSSVRLLEKMGYDFDEISDAIAENPDVDAIDQGLLMYAIPIDADHDVGKRYLYEFFNWLIINDPSAITTEDIVYNDDGVPIAEGVDRIVTFSEGDYHMQLQYGGMRKEILDNTVIGPIGTVRRLDFSHEITESTSRNDTVDGEEVAVFTTGESKVVTEYVFQKQISDTKVVQINTGEIQLLYEIDGQLVYIDTDEEEGRLLIPIHYGLSRTTFSTIDRNLLYAYGARLVFNSITVQKIPWYATSTFQFLMALVGVAAVIFSLGTAAPGIIAAYTAYAATYGAVVAVVILALQFVAINLVLSQGMKYVAEELGGETALILGTALLITGIGATQLNASFASNLMTASVGLVDASTAQINIETIQIGDELETLKELEEAKLEEVEDALDSISGEYAFDPLEVVGMVPYTNLGESSSDFYARTLSVGAVTAETYSYISEYHERNLRLPTFADTINRKDEDELRF